jgi:hypothetical protein
MMTEQTRDLIASMKAKRVAELQAAETARLAAEQAARDEAERAFKADVIAAVESLGADVWLAPSLTGGRDDA